MTITAVRGDDYPNEFSGVPTSELVRMRDSLTSDVVSMRDNQTALKRMIDETSAVINTSSALLETIDAELSRRVHGMEI